MAHKTASAGRYVVVWIGLVTLTLVSFALSYAHLGTADVVLSLLIAVIKSLLVMLFFMHLIEQRLTNALAPAVTLGFIVLLLSLVATDVLTRHTFPKAPVPFTYDTSAGRSR